MKRLFLALAAIVAVILVAAFVAPFLIPADVYKERIVQAARDATGRELGLNGDIEFSVLPRLELKAEDVAFANAPGAATAQMATLDQLVLQLQLWPLLSGEVKVDSFVLVGPVINLEIDENGRPNWQFDDAGAGGAAPADTESAAAPSSGEAASLPEISLGDVRLENGRVTFRDARGGEPVEISGMEMKLSLPDLDSPVGAEGSLVWNGEKLSLEAEAGNLRGLMAGRATQVALSLQSAPLKLAYSGSVAKSAPPKVAGEIELDVPSVRNLAAWAGTPLDAPGEGLGPLKIAGKIEATDKVFAFTEASIGLDAMNATGDLTADVGGRRPVLKGRLDVDKIDLNTYLPPAEDGKGAASGGEAASGAGAPAASGEAAGPGEWSDEPLDLEGLKAADVDFALTVGAIEVQNLKLGRSALVVTLKDGLLNLDLSELDLYGGKGKGKIAVDARGAVPAVTKSFVLDGIRAEPLLSDAAGFDRLSGTGRLDISIAAKGRSQKRMIGALKGKGAVKFTDGAIQGIDLAGMVRNVRSAFLGAGGKARKTDFAELSGTFTIAKGILRNDDLIMLNPLVRLAGRGRVDMPKRTVNYRLEPKVVASLEGQGGDTGAKGLSVPVIVEGPWHDLSYRPDLAGMVTDLAKDPGKALEGAKETVEKLKQGTGGLGDVLKGIAKPPKDGGLIPDPKKLLKGLFGD